MRTASFFLAPLLCLFLSSVARPDVPIPVSCRVVNLPPGRCAWCAVETLARHHGIKALYGIAARRPSQARPRDIEEALKTAGVKYRMQPRGCRDTAILRTAIQENLGAAVGFRPTPSGGKGHIVTLVDFNDEEVHFLDPNKTDRRVRTLDMDTFLQRWDGYVLVLERP